VGHSPHLSLTVGESDRWVVSVSENEPPPRVSVLRRPARLLWLLVAGILVVLLVAGLLALLL
jgi:hypothetical protein